MMILGNEDEYVECLICGREFRNLTSHLLRVHQVSAREYKQEFGVDFVVSRSYREMMSQRQRGSGNGYRALNKEQVIQELRSLGRQTELISTDWLRENGYGYLVSLTKRLFGGLAKALDEAGVARTRREEWSRQRIVSEIREWHAIDSDLSLEQPTPAQSKLVNAARKYFGSWPRAILSSGCESRVAPLQQTDGEVAAEFKAWVDKHGALTCGKLRRSGDEALYQTAKRRFGSLEAAARTLGLPFSQERVRRSLKDWLEETHQWIEEHGPLRRGKLVDTGAQHLYTWAREHYGSLHSAAKEFGLPCVAKTRWSDEELADEFRRWGAEHGPLNMTRLVDSGAKNLYNLAQRRFGSLEAAAKALNLPFRDGRR